jgi:hypothetical protein
LFNVGAAVSLVLCAATAALWIRSYRHFEALSYYRAVDSELGNLGRGQFSKSSDKGCSSITHSIW